MKKLFFTTLLLIIYLSASAQNPTWIVAPNYVSFNSNLGSSQNIPLPVNPDPIDNYSLDPFDYYDGISANHSSNGISNLDGQLNFFIIDGLIYDKDGKYLDYAWSGLFPDVTVNLDNTYSVKGNGGTETLIVPHPTNCTQYYLFGAVVEEGSHLNSYPVYALYDDCSKQIIKRGPWYSNHDNDWGTNNVDEIFHSLNTEINGDLPFIGMLWGEEVNGRGLLSLAASKLQSDGSRFIVSRMGTRIVIIKIYPNGNLGYWKRFMMPYYSNYPTTNRCELELAQDELTGQFTLAFANHTSSFNDAYMVQIMKFYPDFLNVVQPADFVVLPKDPSGLTSPVHGLEFSPDQSKLYFSITPNAVTQKELYVVDLSTTTPTTQILTSNLSLPMEFSQIELGVDGNMYFASSSGLYALTDPNNPLATNLSPSPAISFGIDPTFSAINFQNYHTRAFSLPDQVDEMNYSQMFETNSTCCINNRTYDLESYHSNETGVWLPGGTSGFSSNLPTDIFVKDELRIKAGSSLTIKNMIFHFAPGARVVIENGTGSVQGGKLILEGTTFTVDDRCNEGGVTWLGVEVWGNQTLTQGSWAYSNQGRFEMRKSTIQNSKIEHASIGILLSKRNSTQVNVCGDIFEENIDAFVFDDTRNGGIARLLDADMYNNQRGIWMRKYFSPSGVSNLSYIVKSKFKWLGPLNGDILPEAHIVLDNIKGLVINGSSFGIANPSYYATNPGAVMGIGIGILSRQSQFSVGAYCTSISSTGIPCPNYIRSTFNDLRYGIHVVNSDALTYKVNRCSFNNCNYGIYTIGTAYQNITENNFYVRELDEDQTAGIALYKSTGYKIQENNFTEFDDPLIANGDGNSYGIVINNSGKYHNEVYKNFFTNLRVGGQSEGVNGGTIVNPMNPQTIGLQWKCNVFKSQLYQADLGVNGIIDYNQGYVDQYTTITNARRKAARNEFSYYAEDQTLFPDHDIMMSPNSQQIKYVHLADIGHTPDNYSVQVIAQNALFGGTPVYLTTVNETCPSLLNKSKIAVKNEMLQQKDELNVLLNKLDGGNTAALLDLIATESNVNVVKTALLDESPFLTDEVLLVYLASNSPSAMRKDVLIANSQLSDTVLFAVNNSNLPNGTKNQILAAQNGISEREKLYSEIGYVNSAYEYLYNDLLSQLLLDSTVNATYDEVIQLLMEENKVRDRKTLLDVYVTKNDLVNANQLSATLINELNDTDFFNLHAVKMQIRNVTAVDVALTNQPQLATDLENIELAAVNTHVKARAQGLLEMRDGYSETPDFLPLYGNSALMLQNTEEPIIETDQIFNVVSIYPNPSSGIMNFDLPEVEEGVLFIEIFELSGKSVHSISFEQTNGERVDLSFLQKGTYLARVSVGNGYFESQLIQLK